MTKIKERGYYSLQTEDGVKWMHFSRTFLGQLQDMTGKDIITYGKDLQNAKTDEEAFDATATVIHAGMNAYCLEEDIDIDFNDHKVANWLWEAMQVDDSIMLDVIETLRTALPKPGKKKGATNRTAKKKKRK